MPNPDSPRRRPSIDDYLMGIAVAVRARANCSGQRVGSVIVQDGRIISTGYNGTPRDMTNCEDGGCHRCSHRAEFVSGTGYDLCICVHSEQNALLAAARFGISVDGATFYTTTRPCFGCTKEMLQAGIVRVYRQWYWRRAKRSDRRQRVADFFPRHPELAPRHRCQFVEHLDTDHAAARDESFCLPVRSSF